MDVRQIKEKFDSLRDERKQAEEKRIMVAKRLEEIEGKFLTRQRELEEVRAGRQKALADGEGHGALSKKMQGIEEDITLLTEEIHGLKAKVEKLTQLDSALQNQISTEKIEIAKVRIIDLAREYNELAEALAPIIKQLARCKDDLYGADHVLWADWDCEIFQKVPRISFEPNDYGYFFHRDRDGV